MWFIPVSFVQVGVLGNEPAGETVLKKIYFMSTVSTVSMLQKLIACPGARS
jgi:hypothetical protein